MKVNKGIGKRFGWNRVRDEPEGPVGPPPPGPGAASPPSQTVFIHHAGDMESYAHAYNEGYADGQFHARLSAASEASGYTDDKLFYDSIESGRCTRDFKPGWWCSRTDGHDGPCALRMNPKQS